MTIRHLRGGVALIGTAAEFASADPVLLVRQLSIETDTGVEKIGDGTTHYASLTALPGGGGGGGGTAMIDALTLQFNKTGLTGDGFIAFAIADLTVGTQKGTDLSLIDTDGQNGPEVKVVTASGGHFQASVVYNVHLTALDGAHDELRVFTFTLSNNDSAESVSPYSLGIDTATPLVLSRTFTDMGSSQPFIDVPPGGWIGGQIAAFLQTGWAGDVFNVNGQIVFWRVA